VAHEHFAPHEVKKDGIAEHVGDGRHKHGEALDWYEAIGGVDHLKFGIILWHVLHGALDERDRMLFVALQNGIIKLHINIKNINSRN